MLFLWNGVTDLTDSWFKRFKIWNLDEINWSFLPKNNCHGGKMHTYNSRQRCEFVWTREDACDGASFRLLKIWRNRDSNKAMDYLIKCNEARIVASVLKWPLSKIAQHTGNTTVSWVIICDPSRSPLLNHLDLLDIFLCIGAPDRGSIFNLRSY